MLLECCSCEKLYLETSFGCCDQENVVWIVQEQSQFRSNDS